MIATISTASSRALALVLIATTCLAVGCGHGSSTAASGGGGGGTIGTLLTETTRTAALNAIAAKYASLPQTSATADATSLQSFIKTRSEFLRSGISADNSVWATFTDGTPLVIPLNDFPTASASKAASVSVVPQAGGAPSAVKGAVIPAWNRAATNLPTRSSNGAPLELPASNTVYLINTRQSGDPAVTQTFNTLANTYLPNNSYQPVVLDGTIENLRQVKNAGVVYNIGHAGLGFKGLSGVNNGTQVYAFGTLTSRSPGTDATYGAEIADGEVGFLLVPTIISTITSGGQSRFELASGYFVTDQFILKNWTFAANSLFMSDNCDGGSGAAQPFIQACFTTGLSTYLGWDNAVANSNANESSLFLFDRMLGENDQNAALQPENPAQRPFDFGNILGQMATKSRYSTGAIPGLTLATSFSIDSIGYGFLNGGVANLKDFENPTGNQGDFGLLCPTISSAKVDETNKQLVLTGIFGSDPGSASHAVLVGGLDMTANATWTQTQITINNLASSGAGSTGDISVSVRGHNSNTLQITSWRGTFTATMNPGGSESESTVYTMHLRGILNFLRSSPGGLPYLNPQGGINSVYSDSSAVWDASGSNTEGNTRETIARVGAPAIPLSNTNIIIGNTGRAGSFNLGFSYPPGSTGSGTPPPTMAATVYAYVNDAGSLMKTDTNLTTGDSNSFNLPYFMNFNTMPVSAVNAALDIAAGKWTSADGTQSVSWPSIPSTSAPNPNASRAVSRKLAVNRNKVSL